MIEISRDMETDQMRYFSKDFIYEQEQLLLSSKAIKGMKVSTNH